VANITSREQFKSYCLRRLGSPVINIEVANEQVEDRIDDSIDFWQRNHMDGSKRDFIIRALTQDEIDNKAIIVPDNIIEVHKIVPVTTSRSLFSLRQRIAVNDFAYLKPFDSVSYHIRTTFWEMINEMMAEGTTIDFSKHNHTIRLHMDTDTMFQVGTEIVFEVQEVIDPTTTTDAWNDEILKRYATAQIKRQWSENLKKFSQVQLPGNITMNGEALYQEAIQEINEIEGEMRDRYSLPPMFFMG